jgi:hypothetical protein
MAKAFFKTPDGLGIMWHSLFSPASSQNGSSSAELKNDRRPAYLTRQRHYYLSFFFNISKKSSHRGIPAGTSSVSPGSSAGIALPEKPDSTAETV